MSPERAWALAEKQIDRRLVPDPSEFNRLRTIAALVMLDIDEPGTPTPDRTTTTGGEPDGT